MSFVIKKNLVKKNFTDKNDTSRIKYIVIHYFGSLGTAKAVSDYFKKTDRRVSAHYALDEGETIYQSVEDGDIAWHCGTYGTYYHPTCRNSNSIGIEVRPLKRSTKTMYATDKDWYFTAATLDRLVEFTRFLMDKYNVPLENVVRHYDVTHKICPNPFVVQEGEWAKFLSRLVPPAPVTTGYRVKVTAHALNIRKGPGTTYPVVGVIKDKGTYTIVDTKGGWGKLKSGAGWIFLFYTEKV